MVTGIASGQGQEDPQRGLCHRQPWGLHQAGSHCPHPGSQCGPCPPLALLPPGTAAAGSLAVMPASGSPAPAAACWLHLCCLQKKNTSRSDLRNMEAKSALVTPKNPLAGMQRSAWGPPGCSRALLLQLLLHPPKPASNKSELPSPSRWDTH